MSIRLSAVGAGRVITFPKNMVIKHANINPTRYTNPLKSWLNNDASEKKQTNINGAKRKNKYIKVMIFNSIFMNYNTTIDIICAENCFTQ